MAINLSNASTSLLSSASRVEVPLIKVVIGDYTFGIYDKVKVDNGRDVNGQYINNTIKYPNYIKQLEVTKINGEVNQYVLTIEYTITEVDDPNFFEKVFSSVSSTRKIVFSYGDLSIPYYFYRDEEALITDLSSKFNIASSKIIYTVKAVSSCKLLSFGTQPYFEARYNVQPSTVIKELINTSNEGIVDVFYGMKNGTSINGVDLIPSNDKRKNLEAKTNISVMDYLRYLVSMMTPQDTSDDVVKKDVYTLLIRDDVSGELCGPYFQIVQVSSLQSQSEAYDVDIGTQSKDSVIDFQIDDSQGYSIFYDYQQNLTPELYTQRINERGEVESVFAPLVSSGNTRYQTREVDRTWWTSITSFPIRASITIKGLLRPAILMTYVRLNVYFYGRKHASSGLYVVTKEQDVISETGFKTTLGLLRVGGDE